MCRPEKPIDWERVDRLLEAGCLGTEIAPLFNLHHETFYDRVVKKYGIGFTEYMSQRRSAGDSLIREAQYKKAIKKQDNTMLIWLGKQRLGQKETPNEAQFSDEVLNKFAAYMAQLARAQNALKADDNILSNVQKSE